jgi:hypothetical protein
MKPLTHLQEPGIIPFIPLIPVKYAAFEGLAIFFAPSAFYQSPPCSGEQAQ